MFCLTCMEDKDLWRNIQKHKAIWNMKQHTTPKGKTHIYELMLLLVYLKLD